MSWWLSKTKIWGHYKTFYIHVLFSDLSFRMAWGRPLEVLVWCRRFFIWGQEPTRKSKSDRFHGSSCLQHTHLHEWIRAKGHYPWNQKLQEDELSKVSLYLSLISYKQRCCELKRRVFVFLFILFRVETVRNNQEFQPPHQKLKK